MSPRLCEIGRSATDARPPQCNSHVFGRRRATREEQQQSKERLARLTSHFLMGPLQIEDEPESDAEAALVIRAPALADISGRVREMDRQARARGSMKIEAARRAREDVLAASEAIASEVPAARPPDADALPMSLGPLHVFAWQPPVSELLKQLARGGKATDKASVGRPGPKCEMAVLVETAGGNNMVSSGTGGGAIFLAVQAHVVCMLP